MMTIVEKDRNDSPGPGHYLSNTTTLGDKGYKWSKATAKEVNTKGTSNGLGPGCYDVEESTK